MTLRINRPVSGTEVDDWAESAALCEPRGGGRKPAPRYLVPACDNTANTVPVDTGCEKKQPHIVVLIVLGQTRVNIIMLDSSYTTATSNEILSVLFSAESVLGIE